MSPTTFPVCTYPAPPLQPQDLTWTPPASPTPIVHEASSQIRFDSQAVYQDLKERFDSLRAHNLVVAHGFKEAIEPVDANAQRARIIRDEIALGVAEERFGIVNRAALLPQFCDMSPTRIPQAAVVRGMIYVTKAQLTTYQKAADAWLNPQGPTEIAGEALLADRLDEATRQVLVLAVNAAIHGEDANLLPDEQQSFRAAREIFPEAAPVGERAQARLEQTPEEAHAAKILIHFAATALVLEDLYRTVVGTAGMSLEQAVTPIVLDRVRDLREQLFRGYQIAPEAVLLDQVRTLNDAIAHTMALNEMLPQKVAILTGELRASDHRQVASR